MKSLNIVRFDKSAAKRLARKRRNLDAKIVKAQNRKVKFANILDVIEPPTPPRLSWLGGKQYAQSNPRKNKSQFAQEHREAINENVVRKPTAPRNNENAVYIGEFADHDPAQGAAIDHSIATGEGLFVEPIEKEK